MHEFSTILTLLKIILEYCDNRDHEDICECKLMITETRPLAEITQDAIHILFREIGVVNTVRLINQYTTGYGNYTEERRELFPDQD